ncbi:PseudoU_synth_2 domain-containing protein [Cephalotus follicularis]|uniref:PseudoU_synth_2 domain-containing protein n=1 Tax=Cephalotus follicularis TaxID=3775 RepID=A0A1Q3B2X2_CEPFO|nr:PseudoU_synth_2 domain-containing protein [Cephalotus follicularis]
MLKLKPTVLHHLLQRFSPYTAAPGGYEHILAAFHQYQSFSSTQRRGGKWFPVPPFTHAINGSALGSELARGGGGASASKAAASETTAIKWVLKCCPELPRSLVQKLFRLRQVRRGSADGGSSDLGAQGQAPQLKRVAAKDLLNLGDQIFLPISVQELPSEKQECHCCEEEVNFVRSLELYKDPAIIVVNKPSGMPVQGGVGIKRSLDELAATCLSYDYSEPPRLVHRLDRDCSGILVMGRTQLSATVLHSIFREKTVDASKCEINNKKRILQRRYWALVIGSPRRTKGLVAAPLGKVVLDNGKSDRITVVDCAQMMSSQHAVTEYRVIQSSSHGYTWLELSPLTGRKHQLRVHCAEVLGTPIVGDYKYGWQVHRKWKQFPFSDLKNSNEDLCKEKTLPFGIDMERGSVSEKHPRLHLHCKQIILPNVSQALQNLLASSDYDLSELPSIELVAPMPPYMQRSWDILKS